MGRSRRGPHARFARWGGGAGVPDARFARWGGGAGVPDARFARWGGGAGVPDARFARWGGGALGCARRTLGTRPLQKPLPNAGEGACAPDPRGTFILLSGLEAHGTLGAGSVPHKSK